MAFLDKLKGKRGAEEPTASAGGNAVFATAATEQDRHRIVIEELGVVQPGEYVIFADHDNIDNYVQFARFRTGGLTMEVASGIHNQASSIRLMDSPLAVAGLSGLGLQLVPEGNFAAHGVQAAPDQIASWVEEVFIHMFRADEGFRLDVLGDPARVPKTS